MSTPSEAVSEFFAHLQAGDWAAAVKSIRPAEAELCRARILSRTFRMMQLRQALSGETPLVMKPMPSADDQGPDPELIARWRDLPVEGMDVSTAGDLLQLPAPVFLERLLALHRCDEDGNAFLPWGGKRVEILEVTPTSEDAARVRYAYRDQPPDEYDPKTLQAFQRAWEIDVYRVGSEWLLDVPAETMGPIPIF